MTSQQSDDPRVDELRQRLRSLGYLDAGVDRFVLGPARATRRPSAIAFLASLRVGIIAALLLGPAAALGLSARLPGLVTGPRDAVVVALYLGGFFGVAMAAVAIAASLLVWWGSRQSGAGYTRGGRWLARAAGGLVTLVCLIYLTLWWQTVIAGLGWSAPIWTISALVVAVATSLLLGHAVVVASSAVLLAADGTTESDGRRDAVSSWRGTAVAGAIAFAGAALLLTWSAEPRGGAPAREPLTVVPTGLRLRVIAIDGFDVRVFDSLSSSGRLPALTASLGGARVQIESRPEDAGDPARVWTTVATGQPPDVHGVQGLETRRLAGVHGSVAIAQPSPLGRAIRGATDLVRLTRPAIASGSERRSKTFWEVAAEAGLRTVVVNWWATWPVAADAGRRADRSGNAAARARWSARCRAGPRKPLRTLASALARDQGTGQRRGRKGARRINRGCDPPNPSSVRGARRDSARALRRRRAARDRPVGRLSSRSRHRATRATWRCSGGTLAFSARSPPGGAARLLFGARPAARATADAGTRRTLDARHRAWPRGRRRESDDVGQRVRCAIPSGQRQPGDGNRADGVVCARHSCQPRSSKCSCAGAFRSRRSPRATRCATFPRTAGRRQRLRSDPDSRSIRR